MATVIRLLLENFPVTLLVVGLIAGGIEAAMRRRRGAGVAEPLLAWFLFFPIGVAYLYNFVMHVFFSEMTARFIGWEDSPFQLEVGFASLGFALVGLLAFRSGPGIRLAAIVGPAAFLWGAAGGHVYQMVAAGNFAPGNAGTIFVSDILVPVIGFALLWWRYRDWQTLRSDLRRSPQ